MKFLAFKFSLYSICDEKINHDKRLIVILILESWIEVTLQF